MKQIISWNDEYLELNAVKTIADHEDPHAAFKEYVLQRAESLLHIDRDGAEIVMNDPLDNAVRYNERDRKYASASIEYGDGHMEFLKLQDICIPDPAPSVTKTKKNGCTEERTEHPAYGLLRFARVCGGSKNLVGSNLPHEQIIRLTVSRASVTRSEHSERYYPEATLIIADMSYTQFAELISSMNVGLGTPVTLRFVRGEGDMPPVTLIDKKQMFAKEFAEKNAAALSSVNGMIRKVDRIFSEKRNLKAAERDDVLTTLRQLYTELNCNRDFTAEEFNATMEKITSEAKGEVEAFFQNKMNAIALEALARQNEIKELGAEIPPVTISLPDETAE